MADIAFELERFAWSNGRLEVVGRWRGLGGARLRKARMRLGEEELLASASDAHAAEGEPWRAVFAREQEPSAAALAELDVGRGIVVELPPPDTPSEESRLDAALAAARAGTAEVRAELQRERETSAALRAELERERRDAATLRERFQAVERDLQGLQSLRDEMAGLADEAEESRVGATAVLQERDALRAEGESLRERLAALEGERDNLRTELSALQQQVESAREQAAAAREEADARQAAVQEMRAEVEHVKRESRAAAETLRAQAAEARAARAEPEPEPETVPLPASAPAAEAPPARDAAPRERPRFARAERDRDEATATQPLPGRDAARTARPPTRSVRPEALWDNSRRTRSAEPSEPRTLTDQLLHPDEESRYGNWPLRFFAGALVGLLLLAFIVLLVAIA